LQTLTISNWQSENFAIGVEIHHRRIKMKANMGTIDRIIRTALAVLVGVLWYTGQISGTVAIILGILAIVFLLTSVVSFCPLYAPFRISTKTE
jgi:hypothetical protein